MLKYIGDFEKLKDYGLYDGTDCFPFVDEDEKRYINNNPDSDLTIVIVNNKEVKPNHLPLHREVYLYSRYEDSACEETPIILYDLIKDGLVIKEDK